LGDNLNAEMVDLDAMDNDDVQWLQGMIQAHVDATDSPVGQRVLSDWENQLKNFVKVMPRDFKRVLDAITKAEASGMNGSDVNEAIMAAANG
jgi:glutamate synthase (NADPH/NADH) large chain